MKDLVTPYGTLQSFNLVVDRGTTKSKVRDTQFNHNVKGSRNTALSRLQQGVVVQPFTGEREDGKSTSL